MDTCDAEDIQAEASSCGFKEELKELGLTLLLIAFGNVYSAIHRLRLINAEI
ncbi:hypothetical protein KIN20_033321 [Parelaphostrongylus tenuis]|uniref:Uncharacterized protein n=1 Tax=Parelaphostrongylus tenuis TaxID=148309 RepID=A0AAD5WJ44_PARTN|nr:hypothetical protein KIN20_033321 [Parelaphostrongylus tenuis]